LESCRGIFPKCNRRIARKKRLAGASILYADEKGGKGSWEETWGDNKKREPYPFSRGTVSGKKKRSSFREKKKVDPGGKKGRSSASTREEREKRSMRGVYGGGKWVLKGGSHCINDTNRGGGVPQGKKRSKETSPSSLQARLFKLPPFGGGKNRKTIRRLPPKDRLS